MKKIGFVLGLGFAALASSATSAAELGPYVSGAAGLHFAESTAFKIERPGLATIGSAVKFETGYNLVAALGYRFDNMRTELEVGYRKAGADTVDGSQGAISGSVNVLFDVGIAEGIYPYIGGGVGIANNRWDSVQSGFGPTFHDESAKFQWQAIVGAEMDVGPRTALFIDYRYIGSTDNSYSAGPAATAVGADAMSHNVMVGVRYNFMN